MHFGDSIFIFLMALVLFGPKKLPEIGRQIGKLLGEFRRASNEFKYQIQEELRNMEDEERRKKLAEEEAARTAKVALETTPEPAAEAPSGPSILPPSTGTPVSAERPYATPVESTSSEPEPMAVEPASSLTAAEILAEAPAPADPAIASGSHAHVDLTTPTNGTHSTAQESSVDAGATGEHVHHG
jgi:sec-independent protein translocase protein TatB